MKPLKNTVVHLKTQEEYNEYMRMCEKEGWLWSNGCPPSSAMPQQSRNEWVAYRSETCVDIKDKFKFSSVKFHKDNGYKIITLKELKAMEKKTFKTLEVGDYVKNGEDYFRKVLAVIHIGNDEEESVYCMSNCGNKGTKDMQRNESVYTSFELEECGYTIDQEDDEAEEAIKTLTRLGKLKDGKVIV